jgi:hypothetical protein
MAELTDQDILVHLRFCRHHDARDNELMIAARVIIAADRALIDKLGGKA